MNRSNNRGRQMHFKAAQIAGLELSPNDMAQINQYALSPLNPEDVFAFKVSMAANEVDRDYEVFPRDTLAKFANLFVGKTVVKDHVHKSDNQIARIYATDLTEGEHMHLTKTGEIHTQLIARCYMVKTSTNADLISEIQAGIRKEVSLGCRIGKAVCSICETDNVKTYCKHFPGKQYDGNLCYFSLEDPMDAYELSFVAIPAQQHAGTVKSYGENPCHQADFAKEAASENNADRREAPGEVPSKDKELEDFAAAESVRTIAKLLEEIGELKAKMAVIAAHLEEMSAKEAENALKCRECAENCSENAPECQDCAQECADSGTEDSQPGQPEGDHPDAPKQEEHVKSPDEESEIGSEEPNPLNDDAGLGEASEETTEEGAVSIDDAPAEDEGQEEDAISERASKVKEAQARLRALNLSLSLRKHQ